MSWIETQKIKTYRVHIIVGAQTVGRSKIQTRNPPVIFFFSFTIGLFKPHDDRGGILEIGKVDCNCHLVGVQDLLVLRTQLLIQHQDHLVLLPKNLHHWEEVLLRDYHTLKFDKVLYLVAVDRVNHSQRSRKWTENKNRRVFLCGR